MPNCSLPPRLRFANFLTLAGLVLLVVVMPTALVRADFSGPYTLTPPDGQDYFSYQPASQTVGTWTLDYHVSNTNFPLSRFDTSSAPSSVSFDTFTPSNSFFDSGNIAFELTNTATASGPLSFNYSLTELNSLNDVAGYSINGVLTALPTGSGTVSGVTLNAGDVFGFYVGAGGQSIAYQVQSRTILTVSGFSAPTVPEPALGTWLVFGLAVYVWRRFRPHAVG